MADFKVLFSSDQPKIPVRFEGDAGLKAVFGEVQTVGVGGELYEGDYTVTPKVDKQTMPTKGKLLVKDVAINPIPFFNVSNTSGGNTVYIGNEV